MNVLTNFTGLSLTGCIIALALIGWGLLTIYASPSEEE